MTDRDQPAGGLGSASAGRAASVDLSPAERAVGLLKRRAKRLYGRGWAVVRNRIADLTRSRAPGVADKRFGRRDRGTILLVTHDTRVGGAQKLLLLLAGWLIASTKYSVRFVVMGERGGREAFWRIAPVFDVLALERRYDRATIKQKLKAFAGPDVKGVLVNSGASGGFFDYWDEAGIPVIAYIHELPKVLVDFRDRMEKVVARAGAFLAASAPVRDMLVSTYGVPAERCDVVEGFIEDIAPAALAEPHDKANAKRRLGVAPEHLVVMGCGVLHWRKSPETFIEVAARVSAALGGACRFVWLGSGPDEAACRRLAAARGLRKTVKFLGHRRDVYADLKAADVFLLPSEEDPFPLTALEAAAARTPIVCFEEAGGMPDFVRQGRGTAVPFQDVAAMTEAVLRYAADPALRERHGASAQQAVMAHHTLRSAGPLLLHHMRQRFGLAPQLSIVVPSYNYDRFLEERMQSILDQTFQDYELLLLDDASSDGSVETLRRFAGQRAGTRLVVNDANSGSPFRQWLKGMSLTSGGLIWIAEADDTSDRRFVERLLPRLDDRNVFLAYAKSVPIADDGRAMGDYAKQYLDRIAPRRWSSSYVASDHREVDAALGVANSIPNASAVIFRRFEPEPDFVAGVSGLRLCGDWYSYLRIVRGGSIAYLSEPLNFHRRHDSTVTHGVEGSEQYFSELAEVRAAVHRSYRLSEVAEAKAELFLEEDISRFKVTDPQRMEAIRQSVRRSRAVRKDRPSLLVVASDLSPGGGQMFSIRLANAWMRSGARAFLLNARHFPDHETMLAKLDPRVALFHADDPHFSFARLLADLDVDIIHSSVWWADRLVQSNARQIPARVPWVVTMHGCHETLLGEPQTDREFEPRFRQMLQRVDQWVHVADKNCRVFEKLGRPGRLIKLESGYEPEPLSGLDRAALGLRPDSFVVCLASRAIAQKGWHEAVEAVTRLNAEGRNVELLLCGEGPAANKIAQASPPPFIHLCGQVANLEDYIAVADAGLLPSTFSGESMPLVLIECMAQGRPVIATDVGEIRGMLEAGEGSAGVILPAAGGEALSDAIAAAIRQLMVPQTWEAASLVARRQYDSRFSMARMLERYRALYAELCEIRERA